MNCKERATHFSDGLCASGIKTSIIEAQYEGAFKSIPRLISCCVYVCGSVSTAELLLVCDEYRKQKPDYWLVTTMCQLCFVFEEY